jgi:hypothetical protein
VIFSVSHKRAREPVHIVHSENWLLYSYFSDKSRRTEIVTLELYEGKVQSNTTGKISSIMLQLPVLWFVRFLAMCIEWIKNWEAMFHPSQWFNEFQWNFIVGKCARSDQSNWVRPVSYMKVNQTFFTFRHNKEGMCHEIWILLRDTAFILYFMCVCMHAYILCIALQQWVTNCSRWIIRSMNYR